MLKTFWLLNICKSKSRSEGKGGNYMVGECSFKFFHIYLCKCGLWFGLYTVFIYRLLEKTNWNACLVYFLSRILVKLDKGRPCDQRLYIPMATWSSVKISTCALFYFAQCVWVEKFSKKKKKNSSNIKYQFTKNSDF